MKKNTTLEYSTRVVQEGDRRCEKSTLNDLAYLTPLRIPLMNPVNVLRETLTQYITFNSGERGVFTLVLRCLTTVMSCIDPSVRIFKKSP